MVGDRVPAPDPEPGSAAVHDLRAWTTGSEEATREVGAELAAELAPDGVLLLFGELGAGKTVLVQGVARGLGIGPTEVQSPSYVLERVHRGPAGTLHHLDLYRLNEEEVAACGLEEVLAGPGVKVVEWAEHLGCEVPGAVRLRVEVLPAGERRILEIEAPDAGSRPDTGERGGNRP